MANDFYTRGAHTGFYSPRTEPDMRQEVIDWFDGKDPQIPKAQVGLHRKMRRTSAGVLIPCTCVDRITKEPDKDRFCPICWGEGFLWDEEEIQFYISVKDTAAKNALKDKLREPGLINVPLVVFYIRYDVDITREDKILTLLLDKEGTPVEPKRRNRMFTFGTLWEYRSDNGRLEYTELFAHLEIVKHLNPPTYGAI